MDNSYKLTHRDKTIYEGTTLQCMNRLTRINVIGLLPLMTLFKMGYKISKKVTKVDQCQHG